MKLYTPLGHPRGNKILTLARYLKLDLETPAFNIGQAKNKEFAAKSPLKKFPLLETSEGCLYESNAIIRHLVRVSGR
jgi:elongation factor 1-gamma